MRIGLQIPSFTWPEGTGIIGPKLAEIGRSADEAGFASVWVMDHFFQIGHVGDVDEPMLEGYSALSYLAAFTERVKLGTLVTGVIYRYPGLWSRPRPRSTCSRGEGPTSASVLAGTSASREGLACLSLPPGSASSV